MERGVINDIQSMNSRCMCACVWLDSQQGRVPSVGSGSLLCMRQPPRTLALKIGGVNVILQPNIPLFAHVVQLLL